MNTSGAANSIFIGGPLYGDADTAIANLAATSFAEVVGWATLSSDGTILYQGTPIASGGNYVGNSQWPSQLAGLRETGKRLQLMIGGSKSKTFDYATKLIFPNQGDYPNNPQIGPDSILYRNFKALKAAIPGLNGVNFDDEGAYDQPTIVNLARLLASIDLEATCNPYTMMEFWVDCVAAAPEAITRFYLQTYAGGAGNNPEDWIAALQGKMGSGFDAKAFVFPGVRCRHGQGCSEGMSPAGVQNQFEQWQPDGLRGGWLWIYDDVESCAGSTKYSLQDYATAISRGIGG